MDKMTHIHHNLKMILAFAFIIITMTQALLGFIGA
jgi:hypothetical protein